MTDRVYFHSLHSALKWYYAWDRAQIAPQPMNDLARSVVFDGLGLHGNDGAMMAGYIGRELGLLSAHQLRLLEAAYAPHTVKCDCRRECCAGRKPNKQWEAAIAYLSDRTMSVLAGTVVNYRLRRGMIEKIFGRDVSLAELATQTGVHRDTASAQHAKLVAHLKGERGGRSREGKVGEVQRVEALLDERLRARGLIGDEGVA